MSLTTAGIEAEQKARLWIKSKGYNNLQQIDWIIKSHKTKKFLVVEVKHRELFNPPPFFGTGLDINQINLRRQLYDDFEIDTLLLVFEIGTENIYYNFLFSVLEKLDVKDKFDTKNGIRIYNIDKFIKETFKC
mgnify:CR=1 FL=1